MKAFECSCQQPLFFANLKCLKCDSDVGFDPATRQIAALLPVDGESLSFAVDSRNPKPQFRFCAHRTAAQACNWLVPVGDEPNDLCVSCRLTRTIPNLSNPRNSDRLREVEAAKRRVLFDVLSFGLPILSKRDDEARGLAFDFLESSPGGPPILTGHAQGLITLNVAEADPDYREKNRERLTEPYRTLIGHFRHELAHYYWDLFIRDTPWLDRFRAVFGDDRTDYAAALERHYAEGPPVDWQARFISAYAASHPWEDWAESWAHYFHLRSTLETVIHFGLRSGKAPLNMDLFGPEVLYRTDAAADSKPFLEWVNTWVTLTAGLNEVARSMGQPDLYPFVLNGPAVTKLHFVHCVIRSPQG